MSKTLTALEFEKMERARLLKEFRSKEAELIEARAKLVNARQQMLELSIKNLEIERRVINEDRDKLSSQRESDRKAYEEVVEGVKKSHSVEGKFGYNPDTLEIIEEDPPKEESKPIPLARKKKSDH